MGSQGKKEKITAKIILNIFAILIILPIALELITTTEISKLSLTSKLIGIYDETSKNKTDFVEFINVGQGDCTLIKSGDSAALIDLGIEEDGEKVYKKLLKYGIRSIEFVVITHHHDDHMGGFLRLAEKMEIKNLLINNSTAEDGEPELYEKVISLAAERNIAVHLPKINFDYKIGNATLRVLDHNPSAAKENNRSVVTMLSISNKKLLFTGDGDDTLERNLTDNCNLKCNVLKMGHHGSNNASYTYFLRAASPEIAVASCGYDNTYNHPSDFAVARANDLNIRVYRTDLDGDLRLNFDDLNASYEVITERGNN